MAAGQFDDGPEEVIGDPELGDADADPSGFDDGGADEAIEDPELSGAPDAYVDGGGAFGGAGFQRTYELHGLYHSRLGVDLAWDDPREEVWEVQQVAQLEALLRHSESTRFALGLRVRHGFFAWERATMDAQAQRTMFDVLPVAAYVDTSPALGLHLRAGYQMHHLGRFDVLSASNVLAAYDMRSGPTTIPGANEVAQLGLRADWDLTPSLSLRAVYLPFFLPHLIDATEGDYALIPDDGSALETGLAQMSAADMVNARASYGYLRETLSRTGRAQLARSGVDAFAPDADLLAPQGALRANLRGADGELGLTLATAIERVPIFAAPEVTMSPTGAIESIRGAPAEFGRIWVAALDGAMPLGPVQLGAELSYTFSRALYGGDELTFVDADGVTQTAALGLADETDLAQLGLRAEWTSGSLLLAAEAFWALAINSDPAGSLGRWLLLAGGRHAYGAVAFAGYAAGDFAFELGVAALNGPSLYVQPRIAYEILPHTLVELGAHIMQGASPASPSDLSIGAIFDPIDQFFLGLRYGI